MEDVNMTNEDEVAQKILELKVLEDTSPPGNLSVSCCIVE